MRYEWYVKAAAGRNVMVIVVRQIMVTVCGAVCFLNVVANGIVPVWRNTPGYTTDLKLRLTRLHPAVNTSPSFLSYRSRPVSLRMLVVVKPLTTQSDRLLPFLNWKLPSFIEMQDPHWNAGRLSRPVKMSVITLTLPSSLRHTARPLLPSFICTLAGTLFLFSIPQLCLVFHATLSNSLFASSPLLFFYLFLSVQCISCFHSIFAV